MLLNCILHFLAVLHLQNFGVKKLSEHSQAINTPQLFCRKSQKAHCCFSISDAFQMISDVFSLSSKGVVFGKGVANYW